MHPKLDSWKLRRCLACILAFVHATASVTSRVVSDVNELNKLVSESQVQNLRSSLTLEESQLVRPDSVAALESQGALPVAPDIGMYDRDGQRMRLLQFNGASWYPTRVEGNTVLLASTAVRTGTRPSAQQIYNREHKSADDARREQLQVLLKRNQELSAVAESENNATEVGRLYLDRKQLQTELDRSLAVQSVHSDRVIVNDLLRLNLGVNLVRQNDEAEVAQVVFIGPAAAPSKLFQFTISPDDSRSPISEFGDDAERERQARLEAQREMQERGMQGHEVQEREINEQTPVRRSARIAPRRG